MVWWRLPPTKTIPAFNMIREYHRLRIENKRGRGAIYALVKKKYGLKGSRVEVLAGLRDLLNEKYGDFEGHDK